MDTNRFRKRTDYATPVRRQAPVLDELGQLRQPTAAAPVTLVVPVLPLQTAAPVPPASQGQGGASATLPRPVAPVAPPRPVYEQKPPPESLINLNEATNTTGWIDEIADPPVEPEPLTLPAVDGSAEAVEAMMAPTNISIQISLPKLHKPELPALPYKRIARWAIIVAVALTVVIGGLATAKHFIHHAPQAAATAGGYQALAAAALTKPSFAPIAPSTKPSLAEVGNQGTSFDGTRDSYSYSDTIENVPLIVSQQPLPSKFSNAAKAVSTAAQAIGARQTITTKSTVAYMATSSKTTNQSLVFSLKGLLIFIQSDFPHSADDWKNYINSLQ
jgi:hypothetical protein